MREWAFKMRGGLWTLLFVVILFALEPASCARVCACLAFVVLGQAWRCFAAGYIGLYRGESVKAQRLAVGGPYALMRNPLYFGNFLIGFGWSIMAGVKGILIFAVCFYILYVLVIIPHEESFLRTKFGQEYEDYCARVKRFWPALKSGGVSEDNCGEINRDGVNSSVSAGISDIASKSDSVCENNSSCVNNSTPAGLENSASNPDYLSEDNCNNNNTSHINKTFDAKIIIKSEIHTIISTIIGTLIIIAVSVCYT